MPKVAVRRAMATLSALLAALPVWGRAEPVVVRAAKPPETELVNLIAQGAAATRLDPSAYPDAPKLSAARVIDVLCGGLQPAYWTELLAQNPDYPDLKPEEVLGERAYKLAFPACLYVRNDPAKVVIREGDSAASVYKTLTGKTGIEKNIEAYFGRSSQALASLEIGDELTPSYTTLPTTLQIESADLKDRIERMIALAPRLSSPTVRPLAKPSLPPRLFSAAGHVAGLGYGQEPDECKDAPEQTAIARNRIVEAYGRAFTRLGEDGRSRSDAQVLVIDNGFLGAVMELNGLKFRPGFPEAFFTKTYEGGVIGPKFYTPEEVVPWIAPPSPHSLVAAHGTHVTGLVLGGPDFAPQLKTLLADGPTTKLKVSVANVGNGRETMLPRSADYVRTAVALSGFRIVNISLEYQDTADEDVRGAFGFLFGDQMLDKLYVVAAGNEEGDAAAWYPASYGGAGRSNVITVAATLADGSLAKFSNYGVNVDLAAPGCRVASTIDENHKKGPMSGTSQAAPQVAFAAALLRTLGGLSPAEIKARLIASGDLLAAPKTPEPEGRRDPSNIWSRTRLNTEKALYLYDDYLEIDENAAYVGDLNEVDGLACRAPTSLVTPMSATNVYAFKRDDTGGYVFAGKAGGRPSPPCAWSGAKDAVLVFTPKKKITNDGLVEPDKPQLTPRFSEIRQLVWRTIPSPAK